MWTLWWDDFCWWIRPAFCVHLIKKGILFGICASPLLDLALFWQINRAFVFLQTLTWHCKIWVTEIARHTQKPWLSIYPTLLAVSSVCVAAQMLKVAVSQEEVQRNPSTPPNKHSGVRQMNVSSGARELRLNGQQAAQGVPLSNRVHISTDQFKVCKGKVASWLTHLIFFQDTSK